MSRPQLFFLDKAHPAPAHQLTHVFRIIPDDDDRTCPHSRRFNLIQNSFDHRLSKDRYQHLRSFASHTLSFSCSQNSNLNSVKFFFFLHKATKKNPKKNPKRKTPPYFKTVQREQDFF